MAKAPPKLPFRNVCVLLSGGGRKALRTPLLPIGSAPFLYGSLACLVWTSIRTQGTFPPGSGTLRRLPSIVTDELVHFHNRCGPLTYLFLPRGESPQRRQTPASIPPVGPTTQPSTSAGMRLRYTCLPSVLPGHLLQGRDISFSTETHRQFHYAQVPGDLQKQQKR